MRRASCSGRSRAGKRCIRDRRGSVGPSSRRRPGSCGTGLEAMGTSRGGGTALTMAGSSAGATHPWRTRLAGGVRLGHLRRRDRHGLDPRHVFRASAQPPRPLSDSTRHSTPGPGSAATTQKGTVQSAREGTHRRIDRDEPFPSRGQSSPYRVVATRPRQVERESCRCVPAAVERRWITAIAEIGPRKVAKRGAAFPSPFTACTASSRFRR